MNELLNLRADAGVFNDFDGVLFGTVVSVAPASVFVEQKIVVCGDSVIFTFLLSETDAGKRVALLRRGSIYVVIGKIYDN